jgi:hypothetical protein
MYYGISHSVGCNTSLDYRVVNKRIVPAKKVQYDQRGLQNHKEPLRTPLCPRLGPNKYLHINIILLQQ